MNYFKQIYYEMRHQKMMTWVSISGTALSIFMVMAFFMAESVKTVEVAPELNRNRIFLGKYIHAENSRPEVNSGSGGAHPDVMRKLYQNLDGIEMMAFTCDWESNADVYVKDGEALSLLPMHVDQNFWKIYNFKFLEGKPFDEADCKSDAKKIVLTESASRRIFNGEAATGREVMVDGTPFTVTGVVEDVSPLLNTTYANFYIPFTPNTGSWDEGGLFGNSQVRLLAKEGVTGESLQEQVKSRYAMLQAEYGKDGYELIYHGQPYDAFTVADGLQGSNGTPDPERSRRISYIIYSLLVLLPAINLSSMTRSRLRHRVSEIGVRRAFGAKKISIIGQLFGENLIITLVGGVIGLALSMIFVLMLSDMFFNYGGVFDQPLEVALARPTFEMLFTWKTFLVALIICFVLNVISATVPAWRASKVEPAIAIAKVK